MNKKPSSGKNWTEIGRSISSKKENTVRADVKLDTYYLVIGFEVNHIDAFKNDIHDIAKDYGHAFFYIVKNKVITKIFSFGPDGGGKVGFFNSGSAIGLKNGYINARPGNADYAVTETTKAFKLNMTIRQGRDLENVTEKERQKIKSGAQMYTAYMNDTCTETARDLLSNAGIKTPSGAKKIIDSNIGPFSIIYATNPYMWHQRFKEAGNKEVMYEPPANRDWIPPVGEGDPIFGNLP